MGFLTGTYIYFKRPPPLRPPLYTPTPSPPLSADFNNAGAMNDLPYRNTLKEPFAGETVAAAAALMKGIIS